MKGKIAKKARNVGSDVTSADRKSAMQRPRLTTNGRPSSEGYQVAPRADITSRNAGYMAKTAQQARYSKGLNGFEAGDVNPATMNLVGEHFSTVTNIGNNYMGSSKILMDRTSPNRL